MRILLPNAPTGRKYEGLCHVNENISNFLAGLCNKSVTSCEQGPLRALFKPDRPEDSHSRLVDCYQRVAELFTQLQTQLSHMGWSHRQGDIQLGVEGSVGPYAQVHRSQTFPVRNNKGKLVGLVISPWVVFGGNEDGMRYDEYHTVSKAVILVLEENCAENGEIVQPE
jgi:hypothetical protein